MNSLQTTSETNLVPADVTPADLQSALAGDLRKLSPDGRLKFYGAICQTVGLNPLTKPFEWLELQGKLLLYANKGCAEQLRKIHGVSIEIVERKVEFGCVVVRAKATDKSGRFDEALGAVTWNEKDAANCMMKCETKAKRRLTLSICGLGMLDESELDGVRGPSKEIVSVLNGEESAAARADALNATLTFGEKSQAIEVPSEPISSRIPQNEESQPRQTAAPTPEQKTDASQKAAGEPAISPAASGTHHPPFHNTTAKPAAASAPSGTLDEDTVRNLEIVLSEGDQKAAVKYLLAKGKLKAGCGLETIPADTAAWILKNPAKFWAMVGQ